MSEGKSNREGKEGGESDSEPEDCIELIDVDFEGDSALCPVEDRLAFEIKFNALRDIRKAVWEVKYLVDTVRKRNIIILGRTGERDYKGPSSFSFSVENVDVSHIKPSHLSNAGLLICTLVENSEEIADIKMVVQVSPQVKDGKEQLVRCIYSPVE